MKHSKRERLTPEDFNAALRLRNMEVRLIFFVPLFPKARCCGFPRLVHFFPCIQSCHM
jgi:hypothetical protein